LEILALKNAIVLTKTAVMFGQESARHPDVYQAGQAKHAVKVK
jgi:hypothetical protein